MPRFRRPASVACFLALAGSAGAVFAAPEPVGPAIGNNRYRAAITTDTDRDDFTGRFLPGDAVTVTVAAVRGAGALKPTLVLVDPDGLERDGGVVTTATGVSLKSFRIDKPGLWCARIGGASGTTGGYVVSFRVQSAAKTVLRGRRLGSDVPQAAIHEFSACAGATLNATLVERKGGAPVEMRELTDPAGASVLSSNGSPAVDGAVRRGLTTTLKHVLLDSGAGQYALRVRIPQGEARYDLTLDVRSPRRPASAKLQPLTDVEPVLDTVPTALVANAGTRVRFTGTGFSTGKVPTVLFGGVPSAEVTVGGGGTTIDALVPARKGAAVVDVRVVNPDGQASLRPLHFAWIPAPSVSGLVDAATGADVRSSVAQGGRAVRLLGADFEAGQTVSVGGSGVATVVVAGTGELRFSLPAAADGMRTVTVSDPYGRSGTSSFEVRYKSPPAFAANPYSPGAVRVGVPTTITVSGSHFAADDQFRFAGQPASATYVDASTFRFSLPALSAGAYSIQIVDGIGTAVDGPPVYVKVPPTIGSVSIAVGDSLTGNVIPLQGGTTVRVDGTNFLPNDTVTLGGVAVASFTVSTPTRKEFPAPAGVAGPASIVVVDGAGQSASAADAIRYAGLLDASAARLPSASAADSFVALRGAAADLDRDGRVDDVVLAASRGATIGTRKERLRVLLGDPQGTLQDATGSAVPAANTDTARVDTWDGSCLAIGDLDGSNGPDIVLGGDVTTDGQQRRQVRLFLNGGSGSFTLDEAIAPSMRDAFEVSGLDTSGYVPIFGAVAQEGVPRAIVMGDLDGAADGNSDPDVIVGTDHYESRLVKQDLAYVDFETTPATVSQAVAVNYTQFLQATRVYENRIRTGGGLTDVTEASLPSAGDDRVTSAKVPAFHCRDLALGDVDGDGDLDLVVAWNDPLSVTAAGLAGGDSARTATRILLNDGAGMFTDATATWMPAVSAPEYWQADRIVLRDMTGDGLPELVLVTSRGLDAWSGAETHTRRALRVLRNDANRFTDVTTSALPAVVTATGDDLRGDALLVTDLDRDGIQDIVVATDAPLQTQAGVAAPRLRPLFGTGSLQFVRGTGFAERLATDTGESDALIVVPDLLGVGKPVLVLTGETRPQTSPSTRPSTRAEAWQK